MFNQSIVFEQPVNELIRVCLRIEHLLTMIQTGLRGETIYDSRSVIIALLDCLTLTDRPDLRGKLGKELMRQRSNFQRFIDQEKIDQTKLKSTLDEMDRYLTLIQDNGGKFGANLREKEFLNNVRQHLSTNGGALSFDTPAFHYWLSNPVKKRHAQIATWLKELEDLFHIVQFMLKLIRRSGHPVLYTAHEGFFQTSLDPQLPCQLIIVTVPITSSTFPVISVGRHGVVMRFYNVSSEDTQKDRPQPCEADISFYMSCCIL